LQTEFDNWVAPLWSKIHENQKQAQAAHRDTLLPRLISSQLRLPEASAVS
jgi:type I restriction enzyme S subunit